MVVSSSRASRPQVAVWPIPPVIIPSVSGGAARRPVSASSGLFPRTTWRHVTGAAPMGTPCTGGRARPMAVGRLALAWRRLAGKPPIVFDEARAGVVTQPMAHPVQVRQGQLTHCTLRRLHDEHDRSGLVYREHFRNGHGSHPPLPTDCRVHGSSHPPDPSPPRRLTRQGGVCPACTPHPSGPRCRAPASR